jgi:hypothetical protein
MKKNIHDGRLWDRLYQTIKVEEPIEFRALRRWCRDVPVREVDQMLNEMIRGGRLECSREWCECEGRSDLRLMFTIK